MGEALIGLAGVVIGLLGASVMQLQQRRSEDGRQRRALRIEIYTEVLRLTNEYSASLDWLTDEPLFRSRRDARSDLPNRRDVTARLQLVANPDVWQAWGQVLAAFRLIEWNWTEFFDQEESGPTADDADESVAAARAAIDKLAIAMRKDLHLV